MNILVTGGAGFIGSHIVDQLISRGHQVIIIDNLVTGQTDLINPQAVFYQEDIMDKNAVDEIFTKHKIDIVFHEAAQMNVGLSVRDPIFDAENNIIGSINILEASRLNGVKKFIFASSAGTVYGDKDKWPVSESSSLNPVCPYGVSKVSLEKYAYFYYVQYGLEYVALRYANVYGPRQNPHGESGVVAIFTNAMLQGKQCYINGDGETGRDYVYIDDVVNANILALKEGFVGEYNISTGLESSTNQIFDLLKKHTKSNFEALHRDPRMGEQRHGQYSYDKIHQAINWQPQTNLQQGLLQTVEYFKNRG